MIKSLWAFLLDLLYRFLIHDYCCESNGIATSWLPWVIVLKKPILHLRYPHPQSLPPTQTPAQVLILGW